MKTFLISIAVEVEGSPVTIWLTSDGLETGRPCLTVVNGADALLTPKLGNTTVGVGGNAWNEYPLTETKGGRGFTIQIKNLPTDVFVDLKEIIDAAIDDPLLTITVTFAGEPGSVTVQAVPWSNPVPFQFSEFSSGWIKNSVLALMTTQIEAI